jgi:hypothetical protein
VNALSDTIPSTPPPIPPRPVNMKLNTNIAQRFQQNLLPPLHNNDVLLLPPRSIGTNQRPPSSLSSNESLSDSFGKNENNMLNLFGRFFLAQLSNTSGDLHPVSLQNGINNQFNSGNEIIRYKILM